MVLAVLLWLTYQLIKLFFVTLSIALVIVIALIAANLVEGFL